MSIFNKTTAKLAKVSILYELAKHNKQKEVVDVIKTGLKKILKDIDAIHKATQES